MATKKQTPKKTTKKAARASKPKAAQKRAKIMYNDSTQKKDYFFPVALLITAIVILGFVSNGTFFFDKIGPKEQTIVGDQTVLVTVNGEEIYQGEIDEYWDRLPPQIKVTLSREELLEEFIQERLLLQEAKKEGITVTESEIDEYITSQLAASGLTVEQFNDLIGQQGTTMERMREIYERQLKLAKLFEQRSSDDLNSTEEEIAAYYEDNKEQFKQDDQVTVRHLLVLSGQGANDTQALATVTQIQDELDENYSNFCDLVSTYSGDPGSVNTCGEYTFPRGVMVQEFEEAGFDMDIGEFRIVKTNFGYHMMIKDAEIPASYLAIDEETGQGTVAELIRRVLAEDKARVIYEDYIAELREESDIIYASEQAQAEAELEAAEDEEAQEEAEDANLDENDEAKQDDMPEDSAEPEEVIIEIE